MRALTTHHDRGQGYRCAAAAVAEGVARIFKRLVSATAAAPSVRTFSNYSLIARTAVLSPSYVINLFGTGSVVFFCEISRVGGVGVPIDFRIYYYNNNTIYFKTNGITFPPRLVSTGT